MLKAREVADFLREVDTLQNAGDPTPAHAIVVLPNDDTPEGELRSQPDRMVAVRVTGGGAELGERTRDQPTVQVYTRGLARNDADAQALASAADDALMGIAHPLMIGATRVISVQRLSGPPGFTERDDARRSLYSCSYVLQVARTVF